MSDNIQQQKAVDGVAGLKKHDIKTSGVVFLIYCLVAAGAFGIEEMIPEAGPGMTIILLVVFPIIWAWPISNICAEMGSVLPAEGGVYIWGQEAYGEFWGYQLGWYNTMSIYITNGVYVALVVGYVRQFIPMSDTMAFVLKVLMIVIFTVINLLGIREVSKASTVFSVLIVLAFALVAVVGLINWNQNPMEPMLPPDYNYLDGISGGICIAVWMYCGYECISTVAGEVKNPQVIPKGLLIAMPLIALTYVLPTLGGLASVGNWENWSTDGGFDGSTVGYATVLTQYLGPVWGYIFLFIAIISQCAIFNTYLASGSRGFFVMADDYLFPKALVKNSKRWGTPYIGILSLSAVTLILANFNFSTLVNMEVVFILALYIILPLCTIKLRKKYPVEERKKRNLYVMPGGKFGLYFFTILPIAISIFALLINGTDYFMVGVVGIITGPVSYILFKIFKGGLYRKDPERYPINEKTRMAVGDLVRIGVFFVCLGGVSFLGQFWLQWYEIDYGEWGTGDYDMFANYVPQMLDILQWGGLALLALGIVLMIVGYKMDKPLPEEPGDIDEAMTKYV